MRRALLLGVLGVGVALGAIVTSAVRDDDAPAPVLPTARPATVDVVPDPEPAAGTLLVWVPGGFPAGFAARLATDAGLTAVTTIRGDVVQLVRGIDADGVIVDEPGSGRTIPIDAVAIDCASWRPLVPVAEAVAVCDLAEDEALLGVTSARLRRLGAGGTLTLSNGRTVRVAGVVDDEIVGAAELVLPLAGAAPAGVRVERYALASFDGDRSAAEARIRSLTDVGMRVRGPGETPWLRHGDAVLPPSLLKEVFGEFAARPLAGGALDVDPVWKANLVTVDLPVLGSVTCHRALVPALAGAFAELVERGLLRSLDRRTSGCWNPRVIGGTDQPSRHAWGAAIDLIPLPPGDEVVEIMERWGFTWGGRWIGADPPHFEYVRPPDPTP